MYQSSADYPYHLQAVEALRASAARIYAGYGLWYCEVRSTLRAMGVSRQAGLRRIVDSGAPLYQRFSLHRGAGAFVTDAELNRLLALFDERPPRQEALIRRLQHKHGKVLRYLPWVPLAETCGFMSAHSAVRAWLHWFCIDLLPVLLRHGYYEPATHYEPPPMRLLDALEIKEDGRAVFNQVFPGLGDALAGDEPGGTGDTDDMSGWDSDDRRDW